MEAFIRKPAAFHGLHVEEFCLKRENAGRPKLVAIVTETHNLGFLCNFCPYWLSSSFLPLPFQFLSFTYIFSFFLVLNSAVTITCASLYTVIDLPFLVCLPFSVLHQRDQSLQRVGKLLPLFLDRSTVVLITSPVRLHHCILSSSTEKYGMHLWLDKAIQILSRMFSL